MELAKREAVSLGHDRVGPEHILLGLLSGEKHLAAHALEQFGVTSERVRPQVAATVGSGESRTSGETALTPQAREVVERATGEARRTGCGYVGPEHILLSLLRDDESVVSRILRNLDVEPGKVRDELLRWLNPGAPRRIPPPTPGLDWRRANLLWRPEGVELRVPLRMDLGAIATFAADEAWSRAPLAGLRREIWTGWLAVASPTLLEDIGDPRELRRLLDVAAQRAIDSDGGEGSAAAELLRRLRAEP
jgi:hypothetical protein